MMMMMNWESKKTNSTDEVNERIKKIEASGNSLNPPKSFERKQ